LQGEEQPKYFQAEELTFTALLEINKNSEIDDDLIQQRQNIRYANKTFPWQQEIINCKTFPGIPGQQKKNL
jgi:hypothetical protein